MYVSELSNRGVAFIFLLIADVVSSTSLRDFLKVLHQPPVLCILHGFHCGCTLRWSRHQRVLQTGGALEVWRSETMVPHGDCQHS